MTMSNLREKKQRSPSNRLC